MLRVFTPRARAILAMVVVAAAALACDHSSDSAAPTTTAAPAAPAAPDPYLAKVQAFRDKHESDYRRDWVSIAGLHFLETGAQTVGSATSNDIVLTAAVPATIGRLIVKGDSVRYEPAAGVTVTMKDQPITAPVMLKETGKPPAGEMLIGDVRLVIHLSGERLSLRVRDPNGPLAKDFRGFSWFPIDTQHKVTGKFIPDQQSKKMAVLNTFNDVDTYAPKASSSSRSRARRFGCGRSRRDPSASTSCSATARAARKPTRPPASSMPTCRTTARRCWTSTKPTTRRARSTRIRPARSR